MIDAILYVDDNASLGHYLAENEPDLLTVNDQGQIAQPLTVALFSQSPTVVRGEEMMVYARLSAEELEMWRGLDGVTVMAERYYTGPGTATALFDAVRDGPKTAAIYDRVYPRTPQISYDDEGNELEERPPENFGMLAEFTLDVPASITARQARLVLINHDLLDRVEETISTIKDDRQRRIVQVEWTTAGEINRNDQWVNTFYSALGLTTAQKDQLFIEAAGL